MTHDPDIAAVAAGMKRGDAKMLARLIATNGGGIYYELIPAAQRKRMIALGLAAFKSANAKRPENIAGLQYGQVIHGRNAIAVKAHLENARDQG